MKTGVLWDFFDHTGARVKKTVDGVALIIGLIDSTRKRVVSYQYDSNWPLPNWAKVAIGAAVMVAE